MVAFSGPALQDALRDLAAGTSLYQGFFESIVQDGRRSLASSSLFLFYLAVGQHQWYSYHSGVGAAHFSLLEWAEGCAKRTVVWAQVFEV